MDEDAQIDISQIGKSVLLEFLEVAMNTLLYTRQIYPALAFQQCRKYDVPVQICIHPDVSTYIKDMLQSLKPVIESNELEYVAFVVTQPKISDKPLERFVFDVSTPNTASLKDDRFLLQLEQALRSFLLKLNICDSMLKPLPSDVSWTVQVKTSEACILDMQTQQKIQDFKWLQADEEEVIVPNANIVPLRAMDANVLKMQLYVEEGPGS